VRPWLAKGPLALILAFAPTAWANMLILGDFISYFTLGTQRAFVSHALHHFYQTPTNVYNVHPLKLIDRFLNPRL
jgi:hypothetical protein